MIYICPVKHPPNPSFFFSILFFPSHVSQGEGRKSFMSVCCHTLYEQQVGRQDYKLIRLNFCWAVPLCSHYFISCHTGWIKKNPIFSVPYLIATHCCNVFCNIWEMFYDIRNGSSRVVALQNQWKKTPFISWKSATGEKYSLCEKHVICPLLFE